MPKRPRRIISEECQSSEQGTNDSQYSLLSEESLNETVLNQRLKDISKIIKNSIVPIDSAINEIKELLGSGKITSIDNGPILTSIIENRNKFFTPKQRFEIVELLVNYGANINFLGEENDIEEGGSQTPLMAAAHYGDENIVKYLIGCPDIDLEIKDRDGYTALANASFRAESSAIVKVLLEAGAKADERNDLDNTPLFIASAYGNVETVKLLLKEKANPNQSNNNVPILVTASTTNIHVVQALLDYGADINTGQIYPPLINANKSEVVRLLVNYGAEINYQNENGYSYLMIVVLNKKVDAALSLIENDIDISITDSGGRTALMIAYNQSINEGHLNSPYNIIDLLLIKGSNPQDLPDAYEGKKWLIERSEILNKVEKNFTNLPDNYIGKEWLVSKKEEVLESITKPIIDLSKSILKSHQYSNNASLGMMEESFKSNILISGEDIRKIVKKYNPRQFPATQINVTDGHQVDSKNNEITK